jgi:hypothetical protein
VVGLGGFGGERQWFLQGRLPSDDARAVRAPLALLRAPALESLMAPRRFPTVSEVLLPSGKIQTSGAEPPWDVAWQRDEGLTTWALGVGSSQWLAGSPTQSLAEVFPSWRTLCPGQPLFAVGVRADAGTADGALSLRDGQVEVESRLPTSLLLSWLDESDAER